MIQVVGDIILDRYVRARATRLSPEGPVPVLTDMEISDVAGGAANVAMNLVGLGVDTCIIGVVGAGDDNGRRLVELLEHPLMSIELIEDSQAPTTTKTRIVADGQCLLRMDHEKTHSACADQVRAASCARKDDIIVISDYNKGAVYCSDSIIEGHAGRVLVDPKRYFEHYHGAWLIKPNRREFEQFVGHFQDWDELVELARDSMYQHDIENMLVTLGADGMILVTQDSHLHVPSLAQEVFDITGAGDVVMAVVAYAVHQGISLARAVEMASKAAARAVAHHGNYVVTTEDIGGQRTVFTNGCFDILHPGHVQYLQQSRALGDRLVVGLNSDSSVRNLKGAGRPVNEVLHRKAMLEALSCVDQVLIFDEDTPQELISLLQPYIITKGGDYEIADVVGHDMGPRVVILPHTGDSTTGMIQRIRDDQA